MSTVPFALTCTAFAVASLAGTAQTTDIPGVRLAKPPTIDGIIGDVEWAGVPKMSGMYDSQSGDVDTDATDYWIAYDDKFIYFAARASDPDPKSIRANEYRSNVSLNGDDFVGLYIDPFGSLNDNNQFEINPKGATSLQIAGGRAPKREWLGEILAKGRITASGYEVEARIPWNLMRMPSSGKRDMRILPFRLLARNGRPYLAANASNGHTERIPYWRAIAVAKTQVDRSVKLLPYTYLGYDEKAGAILNSGLDFKTSLTQRLDLIGSVNPDFRNIENQVLSLDFSYFERLAQETRPFFLEGQNFFRTSLDAPLFASQRIGSFDLGMKTFGKLSDNTELAALETLNFKRESALVASVRHQFDTTSGFQVAATNLDTPRDHNLATFLEMDKQWGPWMAYGQHMISTDTGGNGHRINIGGGYALGAIQSDFEYVEISPKFNPALGFAPETDFRGFKGSLGVSRPFKTGRVSDVNIMTDAHDYRTFENTPYRKGAESFWNVNLRGGLALNGGFSFDQILGFNDSLYMLDIGKPFGFPYRGWDVTYNWGNLEGGTYRSIAPSFKYRPTKKMQVTANYQHVEHFGTQNQTILSASYDLNQYDSISGRLLHQGADTGFYLAFRRAGNKGAEYYLILGDPSSPHLRKSIILKAVVPFSIGR